MNLSVLACVRIVRTYASAPVWFMVVLLCCLTVLAGIMPYTCTCTYKDEYRVIPPPRRNTQNEGQALVPFHSFISSDAPHAIFQDIDIIFRFSPPLPYFTEQTGTHVDLGQGSKASKQAVKG